MRQEHEAVLLRAFIGERMKHRGRPLHEAIVMAARDAGLAGATVLRGVLGFGHSRRIESAKILDLSNDLPLVVEIVDAEARIEAFLPTLDQLMTSGLVTLEKARVLRYGAQEDGSSADFGEGAAPV
jgi:PII-like signaling protein